MNVSRTRLYDKKQTGDAMYNICSRYRDDLHLIHLRKRDNMKPVPLSRLNLGNYYDYVRAIPYKQDRKPIEVIGRPLRLVMLPKLDCKKKAVMIGSYADLKNIPYRFIASSSRPDRRIHHVYPELFISGEWVSYDATYPDYYIGQEKFITAKEVL